MFNAQDSPNNSTATTLAGITNTVAAVTTAPEKKGPPPPSMSAIADSFVRINIHLDSTDYTLIEESPAITSDMLLGLIGKINI